MINDKGENVYIRRCNVCEDVFRTYAKTGKKCINCNKRRVKDIDLYYPENTKMEQE